jgi:hypothetical protein
MTANRITIPPDPARQCARCGALGTHYLTCPILRLPRGYRLGEEPRPSVPVTRAEQRITGRRAADGPGSLRSYRLPHAVRRVAGACVSGRQRPGLPGISRHLATVGSVDEELLAEARRAQERLIDAERDAEMACTEFHRAVHRR